MNLLNLLVKPIFETVEFISTFLQFFSQVSDLKVRLVQFICVKIQFLLNLRFLLLIFFELAVYLSNLALTFFLCSDRLVLFSVDLILLVLQIIFVLEHLRCQVCDDLLLMLVLVFKELTKFVTALILQ